MNNETKLIPPLISPTEIYIDGKSYTLPRLRKIIKFYNVHQVKMGQKVCPLCGSEYSENELFVCDECGQLLNEKERCDEHYDYDRNVCKECCTTCRNQKAFEESVNAKIDSLRGK